MAAINLVFAVTMLKNSIELLKTGAVDSDHVAKVADIVQTRMQGVEKCVNNLKDDLDVVFDMIDEDKPYCLHCDTPVRNRSNLHDKCKSDFIEAECERVFEDGRACEECEFSESVNEYHEGYARTLRQCNVDRDEDCPGVESKMCEEVE